MQRFVSAKDGVPIIVGDVEVDLDREQVPGCSAPDLVSRGSCALGAIAAKARSRIVIENDACELDDGFRHSNLSVGCVGTPTVETPVAPSSPFGEGQGDGLSCDDCSWPLSCFVEGLCARVHAVIDDGQPQFPQLAARLTGPAERPAGAVPPLGVGGTNPFAGATCDASVFPAGAEAFVSPPIRAGGLSFDTAGARC